MSDDLNAGLDARYREPTTPMGSTGDDWWSVGPVLNAVSSDGYVNEANPSWEDVITMVVIPGDPGRIRAGAGAWAVLFNRLEQVKRLLDDGIKDLEAWQGAAGEAYRVHLTGLAKEVADLIDRNRPIVVAMTTAADNLQTAIDAIPIPDDMAYEVAQAKGSVRANQLTGGVFHNGYIYQKLMPIYTNKWADELGELFRWDWAQNKLRDWISREDDTAKKAFRQLADHDHIATMDAMPAPDGSAFSDVYPPTAPPLNGGGAGGGPGGVPGPPGGHLPLAAPHPDDRPIGHGFDVADPAVSGTGHRPGTEGTGSDGTGLAGVGGAGIVGSRVPAGGPVGAGPGGGPGSGGLEATGLPATGPGPGSANARGGPPAYAGGLGAPLAGPAGRGGAGRSAGGGMAMVPPGSVGRGFDDGADHSTWLNEDDDVWGTDNDAPPPVLGR